jgi:hypothetical protein
MTCSSVNVLFLADSRFLQIKHVRLRFGPINVGNEYDRDLALVVERDRFFGIQSSGLVPTYAKGSQVCISCDKAA